MQPTYMATPAPSEFSANARVVFIMAILKSRSRQIELADGAELLDAADELGVPFGCQLGNCGTCLTTVLEGAENLNEPHIAEKAFGTGGHERLICQCTILHGTVILDVE